MSESSVNLGYFHILFFFNLHQLKFTLCGIKIYEIGQMHRAMQTWLSAFSTVTELYGTFVSQQNFLYWPFVVNPCPYFSNPNNRWSFIPIVLPFPKCHRNEIIQHNVFEVWVLLSRLFLSFFHVVCINSLFFWYCRLIFYCTDVLPLFIH